MWKCWIYHIRPYAIDRFGLKNLTVANLFAGPHNLLEVILLGETLNGGKSLSTVPLLDPDVD